MATKKLIDFKVSRRRWLRSQVGETPEESSLMLDGKMCCMGFLARRVGFKAKELAGHALPYDLERASVESIFKVAAGGSKFTAEFDKHPIQNRIAYLNDKPVATKAAEEARDKKLQELFKKVGYNLIYVD